MKLRWRKGSGEGICEEKGAGWCNQRRGTTAKPPCEGQTTRGSHQAHSEGAGSPSRCAGGASWRRPCLGGGRGELAAQQNRCRVSTAQRERHRHGQTGQSGASTCAGGSVTN